MRPKTLEMHSLGVTCETFLVSPVVIYFVAHLRLWTVSVAHAASPGGGFVLFLVFRLNEMSLFGLVRVMFLPLSESSGSSSQWMCGMDRHLHFAVSREK